MSNIIRSIDSWTEKQSDGYHGSKVGKAAGGVSAVAGDVVAAAGKATLLTLSKAWIGVGLVNPAKTYKPFDGVAPVSVGKVNNAVGGEDELLSLPEWAKRGDRTKQGEVISESGVEAKRNDYEKLFSLQLGDYFMPLSQTFTLRAKKKLNVSSLVDGADIIQQTRKEAKTIECTLRIGLRGVRGTAGGYVYNGRGNVQKDLQLVDKEDKVLKLSSFLSALYETDAVFHVSNDMINNTFGITYVIMSEYKFMPRAGMGTYTFEFSLTEVKYGDNVLTADLTQVKTASTLTGD